LSRIEMALSQGGQPADPDEAALLDIARRGASRMRQLIEDLLTYAGIGTGSSQPGSVDMDALVTEVLSDLGSLIDDAGATIRRTPLPRVWGHAPLLGQLVQNLVANALKFRRADDGCVIEITGRDEGANAHLSVADNGIGIDPSHRDEVFGVFTRLNGDDQYAGSGIGLATCAKVVAFHGGSIKVEDGIDGGIAVVVHLPVPDRS
jgi:light-regulated signal transduction histidine kinase (bacteriophytochrome)